MERFNALGRGTQIMLVGAVLLVIDLFLPWQDFGGGIADELGIDATLGGWRGIGTVLGILAIALIVWLGVRIANVELRLPVSTTLVSAALGALILLFGIIKWLTVIDDEATIWAWVGLVLSIVIASGSWLVVQAAGGMATLKSEIPSTPSSSSDTAAAPAAPAAPPPPAPAPAAPEAAAPPEPDAPAEAAGESEESTDREA